MPKLKKRPTQLVGNVGLYYVCFELSKRNWNVLPTSRNTKGVDIVIYNQYANHTYTIQVKSYRRRWTAKLKNFLADYLIIVTKIYREPEIYICCKDEIEDEKKGFIQPSVYKVFKDKWKKIGERISKLNH